MQIPLAQVLEVATAAVGSLQKLAGKPDGEFEAKLTAALSGDEAAATQVEQTLKKLGFDTAEIEELLASGAGTVLVQMLVKLEQAGLSAADLKALLQGEAAGVSDAGLTKLLANLGYTQDQIGAVMNDAGRKAELSAALGSQLGEMLEQFSAASAKPLAQVRTQLVQVVEKLAQASEQLMAALDQGFELQTAKVDAAAALNGIVTQALKEQPAGQALLNALQTTGAAAASVQLAGAENAKAEAARTNIIKPAAAKAEEIVKTAAQELGIEAEQLASLMQATGTEERAAAVGAVTTQVSNYLEAHQGEKLSPEVKDSLQLIKFSMSETEFAPINGALQAFAGLNLKEVASPLNSQILQAALQQLAPQAEPEQQFPGVLDQLRQSFAAELKAPPSSLSLELNPPMLGRVDVSVSMLDGNLSATFKADQIVTRDMLVNNLESLKDSLREQGFNVNQVNVSLDFGRERRDELGFAFAQQQQRDSQAAARAGRAAARQTAVEGLETYNLNPNISYAPGQLSLFA